MSLSPQQHEYSRHPHHSFWLSDRYTDIKCPKIPAAFCRRQTQPGASESFQHASRGEALEGKTFGTLLALSQPPTAQAASNPAAVTDGNICGSCLAFLMSKQATGGCALQHTGQPEPCMDSRDIWPGTQISPLHSVLQLGMMGSFGNKIRPKSGRGNGKLLVDFYHISVLLSISSRYANTALVK